METILGSIERVVYSNQENGYTVFRLREQGTNNLITVTGYFPTISSGLMLKLKGHFGVSKYGEQFEVFSYTEQLPTTLDGIKKYLSSGLIKGIGAVYGERIVNHFKEETLEILDQNPERLREVEGIGEKKCQQIIASYESQKEIKDVMVFLQGHGISTTYALKIYKTYKEESIHIVSENPYLLSEEIYGIGFHVADQIARNMGFETESYKRIKAGFRFLLIQKSSQGHVYFDKDMLLKEGETLLGVARSLLEECLFQMVREGDAVIEEDERVYLPSLFVCENGSARLIEGLLSIGRYTVLEREKVLNEVIHKTQITYNEKQKESIRAALEEKILILTGGPGTGKTTTTLGMIKALGEINQRILIGAPTGRAAKRLSEVTGRESKTIHRLLEYSPVEGFNKKEDNPLDCDILIIDEASMIDIVLFYHLLKAIPQKAALILIGDVDQLPSVGPGNVLKDLIESQLVKTIRLDEIFRQGKESQIILNAHRINQGQEPIVTNQEGDDFFYLKETKRERIFALIQKLCQERLPKRYGYDPIEDIQVLVPVKKGMISTKTLNELLQQTFNPRGSEVAFGETLFRKKDKVMQLKNNYEKNVFNGDIGRVIEVNEDAQSLVVAFDETQLVYEYSELDELQLAYAITIHKSQGSEYPVVIMPIVNQHFMMLQKNLIYTGLTRAKGLFILIGSPQALKVALKKDIVEKRNTSLKEKLKIIKQKWD